MHDHEPSSALQETQTPQPDLSVLVITLLKTVIYREADERVWEQLLNLQTRVREYVSVMGLELVLDEAEGYGFLKSLPEPTDDDPSPRLPRLIARRPLSFPVSLLLALLRKKLAEFDAGGGDTRCILSRDQIVELVRVFLPDSSNDAKLVDQIEAHINKVVELGFLRRLKTSSGTTGPVSYPVSYEVCRIIKAFVDAQWLADFDHKLALYQTQLQSSSQGPLLQTQEAQTQHLSDVEAQS